MVEWHANMLKVIPAPQRKYIWPLQKKKKKINTQLNSPMVSCKIGCSSLANKQTTFRLLILSLGSDPLLTYLEFDGCVAMPSDDNGPNDAALPGVVCNLCDSHCLRFPDHQGSVGPINPEWFELWILKVLHFVMVEAIPITTLFTGDSNDATLVVSAATTNLMTMPESKLWQGTETIVLKKVVMH